MRAPVITPEMRGLGKGWETWLDYYDVRDYGAIGDGIVDDSVAIQLALNYAEQSAVVNKGRGVVFFPITPNGFRCNADIQLMNQVILTGGMIAFDGVFGFESNGKSGWMIDKMTLIGSKTDNQILVYSHNDSVKWWIKNCQFYDSQTGIFATKSYIFRIDDNDMYPSLMNNIVCIKLTSGEGNCSKGTAYDTVNDVGIRGNMLKEYGTAPSPTPLIHIGDSALAPVDPKAITHAKNIDISGNCIQGFLAESGIRIENTKMVTIERNWFERFIGPTVYLAGQWGYNDIIMANGFFGNDDDDYMDPVIKIDSTTNWSHNNVIISQNEFDLIHDNHNLIEAEDVIGLVIENNDRLEADKIVLTNCTGVDIRQPEWNFIFDTFADADATPSVKFRTVFNTFTNVLTITAFDDGIVGQEIKVISKAAITYDTTTVNDATHNLDGSSANIVTEAGDYTRWLYDGTSWTLQAFVDISADWSGGL